jgi:hypothetical protein
LIASASTFRLTAAGDLNASVERWVETGPKAKWKMGPGALFDRSQPYWADFLGGSVLWVGRVSQEGGVVAYYNPWSDFALITLWKGPALKERIADFVLISGDALRGEKPGDKVQAIPAWLREATSPSLSLIKVYRSTSAAFQASYPLDEDTLLIPEPLQERVRDTAREYAIFALRTATRLAMLGPYFQLAEGGEPEKKLAGLVKSFTKALGAGDRKAIEGLVSRKQNAGALDNLMLLPPEVRKSVMATFFYQKDNRTVVILINPEWSLWFIPLYFTSVQAEVTLDEVEVWDLEHAKALVER